MDTRMGAPAPNQVFEDFVPRSELVPEADADILQIYLPDFRKEQLRVQVTKSGILRISGQRPKGGDRWMRFHKEFPISANCNQNKITAKYERGILLVRQPKLIIPAEKQDKLPAEPVHPKPQKLAADEQRKAGEEPSKKAEEQAKGEITEPSEPQKPAANEQKTGEEPSKKAEEQAKRESPVSEPKKEEAKSTKGKASELTDDKSAIERSVEAKKSGSVVEDETTSKSTSTKKDLTDTKNAANFGTDLATMLRQPRKILTVTLVVLVVVGIGLYVNNMIRSSREAEE